jgi:uncharacterized membrane protein YsdA (DUF1294 family)/cold shock CspA family protein
MRAKGKLISWNADKAFGFIAPCISSNTQIFIHKKAFANKGRTPQINDIITYTVSRDPQGRTCAVQASYSGEKRLEKPAKNSNKFSLYLTLVFFAALMISCLLGYIPQTILIVYAVLSPLTYFVYAWDKSNARKGKWRTSENTLHLLALAGGWPGAVLAQQRLRHKSQKKAFRTIFWLTVFINIAALYWLVSESGLRSY